jgi:ATP-dependent RNA helicase DeaD
MAKDEEQPDGLFHQLGLRAEILKAIDDVGYETPTPIQLRTIPVLMSGRDLIGQAQTGTGKTAAFAIPILEKLDLNSGEVQALVLAPTRELALQVSDAIHTYAKHIGHVRVLPVYGGQPIYRQMERLRGGVHIVVGTPGRVMDHLRRGTLKFNALKIVVLDEADEMLRMGFIEDVEWILSQASGEFQKALFSATMPAQVRRIADRYLKDPVTIDIEHKTLTVPTTEQRYIIVSEQNKLDTLTRILESEQGAAVLVFAHTKISTAELADRLQTRGFAAEAMHGDMSQAQREVVIRRLRSGQAEIVIATDVAARGLDVEHISHVINYDIPYDPESYVHRIGRTGRAGREGTSITFITPRQQRLLRDIERFTGQRIQPMKIPTMADVAARRIALFKESIRRTLAEGDLDLYLSLIEELVEEGFEIAEIAAASAKLARADKPLEAVIENEPSADEMDGMVRLFIDAGHNNNVRPSDIVGAIANEADVPGPAIGAIDIYDRYTLVELPMQYKDQVLKRMARIKIRNRPVRIKIALPDNEQQPLQEPREFESDRRTEKRRGAFSEAVNKKQFSKKAERKQDDKERKEKPKQALRTSRSPAINRGGKPKRVKGVSKPKRKRS